MPLTSKENYTCAISEVGQKSALEITPIEAAIISTSLKPMLVWMQKQIGLKDQIKTVKSLIKKFDEIENTGNSQVQ